MSNLSGHVLARNNPACEILERRAQNKEDFANHLSKYTIHFRKTIREAFKQESLNKGKFIIVIGEDNKALGIVSEGDFRRAIWDGVSLEEPIELITNRGFVYFSEGYVRDDVKKVFLTTNIRQVPILKEGVLADVIFREDFYEEELRCPKPILHIPVVIMAGGKGTRLDPFTRVLPKPLVPIGDKPVIEIIMDRFADCGITDFYVLVNHKEKMIKAFFEDFHKPYNISYIKEDSFLGTAGALSYLEDIIDTSFIVSNCDIIIDTDYAKIYEFHQNSGYALTLVGSMRHHVVPYGVCTIANGGELEEIREKPEYDFLANTGMYILNPEVLKFIPDNERFDMTDLIKKVEENHKSVGVYPVSGESWIDIGQWEEYKKAIEKLK